MSSCFPFSVREPITLYFCHYKLLCFVLFFSHLKLCPALCNPKDCSMPSFHLLHYLPELTQIHVHRVGDATQLPHSLSPFSPPAPNPSQHQGLSQGLPFLLHAIYSLSWVRACLYFRKFMLGRCLCLGDTTHASLAFSLFVYGSSYPARL